MKNILKMLSFAIIALLAVLVISATTNKAKTIEGLTVMDDAYASPIYQYTFTSDTITDTESDTLTLPVLLYSKWTYDYHAVIDSLSGTQDIDVVVQESSLASGDTDWVQVDTIATLTDANEVDRATGDVVYGVRQRLIVTGTGTQSVKYSIKAVFKKDQ